LDRETRTSKGSAKPRPARSPSKRPAKAPTPAQRLANALAQQAATAEILRLMAASSSDVDPVLAGIAEQAARLCQVSFARILLVDGDTMRPSAKFTAEGETESPVYEVPLRRTSITGRAVLDRATIHHADIRPLIDSEYPDARRNAQRTGFGAVLAVPLVSGGDPLGAFILWRTKPEAFAPDQIALVETFADQAAIAITNVRQFRATQEALEQQTATSEILRVISRSQTDVQPVFDTIAAAALKLCGAASALVTRVEGDNVALVASANLTAEGAAAMREAFPMRIGRNSTSARAILEGRVVTIPDVVADPEYEVQDLALRAAFRSTLAVPLMREGRPIGTITVGKPEPGRFSDSQVALLQTFADQAVIAIENVRLFTELQSRNRDLSEALEQQTATSEILRVISRSPTDASPVFETIARNAHRLSGAVRCNVLRYDGNLLHIAACHGFSPEDEHQLRRRYPVRPGDASVMSGRVIRSGKVEHSDDVLSDPAYDKEHAAALGLRRMLGVPMIRDGAVVGVIVLAWRESGQTPAILVDLLQTFADQAVIAIENVRLFTELQSRNRDLTEALEQQTATSEILRAMSQSPTDTQPVFDVIARSAARLCSANHCHVFRFDGNLVHFVASHGLTPDGLEAVQRVYPMRPGRGSASARAVQSGRVEQIPDLLQDPDFAHGHLAAVMSYRSIVSVPMIREGAPIGAIAVVRSEPGPFPPRQVALLQTFADQAVIAIENVRLFTELQARTAQLTRSVGELRALGEVGQAVSSTLDLGTVLSTIVARATQLTGVDGGSIFEYDEAHGEFHMHTSDRLPPDLVEVMRAHPIRVGEGVLGRMAQAGAPVEIVDLLDTSSYQSPARDVLARHGYRSLLAVPLTRDNQLLGGLAVNRKLAGRFDPQVIELLKTFAAQSAIAIQNARLFREIEIKSRELETASRHKSEFLANMSHELRTPLNAIIGFSEVLGERLFGDLNDKQAEYVTDIAESGRHLLALINDILDLSKIEAGRMELDASDVDLPMAIGHTLSLVRERAQRRGIAIGASFEPGVGVVRADERKVKQVLLNLLSNALKFTPEGGTIDVRAAGFDDRVEVSVKDTGVGIAPEDQEAVFEEFRQVGAADKRIGGTGLGLPISRKFIELHGGRLWVASEPGKGSTFTFSLPRR